MLKTNSFKVLATAIAVAGVGVIIDASSNPAQAACGPDPYLGTICLTAGSYCPRGYAPADGQLMAISQYTALFAYIGSVYGGDGRTSFAVPDLRGRSAVSFGQGPGLTPIRLGQRRGTEFVTQTISQMAPHTHNATFKATGSGLTTEVKASTANATKSVPAAGDFIAAPRSIGRSPLPSAGFIAAANVGTT
ncbi:MAG: tail fiber protein, partial [Magnetovibrio sp.]|nr:tail fiber protein [Magnetovibrio sp.]